MLKTVLVADDGSEAAARAVAWASSFAAERALKLVSVCVGEPRDGGAVADVVRVVLPAGHPASGIMETAVEVDADLVVLGRRGAGGFPSLPMGTTAHVVAGSCGRPVAVVPPVTRTDASPLVPRAVVGIDGLAGSLGALEWAAATFPDAHLDVVHAIDTPTSAPASLDVVTARVQEWCAPLREQGLAFETVVEEGGPAEVLIETARRRDAAALVVGRRAHGAFLGMLGGVSQRVLAYGPCPAIVMPNRV